MKKRLLNYSLNHGVNLKFFFMSLTIFAALILTSCNEQQQFFEKEYLKDTLAQDDMSDVLDDVITQHELNESGDEADLAVNTGIGNSEQDQGREEVSIPEVAVVTGPEVNNNDNNVNNNVVCPEGTIFNNSVCEVVAVSCPNGTVLRGDVCEVESIICPTGTVLKNGVCEIEAITCPSGTILKDNICIVESVICPTGTSLRNGACEIEEIICPTGTVLKDEICVVEASICPAGTVLKNGVCEIEAISCPAGTALNEIGVCEIIAINCPKGTVLKDGVCEVQEIICPQGTRLTANNECEVINIICPTGTVLKNGVCEIEAITCPNGTVLKNGVCEVVDIICPKGTVLTDGVCMPEVICPAGTKKIMSADGLALCEMIVCAAGEKLNLALNTCEEIICEKGKILNINKNACEPIICQAGKILNSAGICEQIVCPTGKVLNLANNSCEQIICKVGQELDLTTGICQSIVCPLGKVLNDSGKCVDIVCATGEKLNLVKGLCERIICEKGFKLNAEKNGCEEIICDIGKVLNLNTNSCENIVCQGNQFLDLANGGVCKECNVGTHIENGVCVQNAILTQEIMDTFTQQGSGKRPVDIMWVVDNSGSMGDDQKAIADNFSRFIEKFVQEDIDFKMAITTTDTTKNYAGKMYHNDDMFTKERLNRIGKKAFINDFRAKIKVGTNGSGYEKPLLSTQYFMEKHAGFFRANAYLIVVIVSDEYEQSPDLVKFYVDTLIKFKGHAGLVKFYTIIRDDLMNDCRIGEKSRIEYKIQGNAHANAYGTSSVWSWLFGYNVTGVVENSMSQACRYGELIKLTGAFKADIREDFAKTLTNMSESIVELAKSFSLAKQVYKGADGIIKVLVNDQVAGRDVYEYDQVNNAIQFVDSERPAIGATIKVHYIIELPNK